MSTRNGTPRFEYEIHIGASPERVWHALANGDMNRRGTGLGIASDVRARVDRPSNQQVAYHARPVRRGGGNPMRIA
jgi:hypothetical protein